MRRIALSAVGLLACTALPVRAQDVSITVCGQTVPSHATGVLANDLTCPTTSGSYGVVLEDRATLDLAGLTLGGGVAAVRCVKRCTVTSSSGTGTIRDGETAGIALVADRSRLLLSNVKLEDNLTMAVLGDMAGAVIRGSQVELTGNGIGIVAKKVKLEGLTATGNYTVLQTRRATLTDSTLSGNTNYAITGGTAVLRDSTVIGSGGGIDVFTQTRPRLVNSTCGVSRDFGNPTQTWGVCTND